MSLFGQALSRASSKHSGTPAPLATLLSPCCGAPVEYVRKVSLHYSVNRKTGRISKKHGPVNDETDQGQQVVCSKCGTFYYAEVQDGVVIDIQEPVNGR